MFVSKEFRFIRLFKFNAETQVDERRTKHVPNDTGDADMDGIGTECDADESNGNSGSNTGGNTTASDADGDGIDDNIDNCQFVVNLDQADAEGDGIGTACDEDGSSSSDESDSIPSIGMLATSLCLLGAAVLVRRD